ncbi:MAG TPA: ECF-type sigma factor [Planctomycetia bacterium]|nr:ECF-type sigma factor [Planctomycetia bacterium]
MQNGDRNAAAELLPLVYDDLRKRAAALVATESPGQTLDATALVHEAYLHLVGDHRFADRRHFFHVAAEAMRRILIDRARKKARGRHGGEFRRVTLCEAQPVAGAPPDELLALSEALDRFAELDPAKAELVKLRYFAGMSEEEAAALLGISRATASRHWAFARAWLIAALDGNPTRNPPA